MQRGLRYLNTFPIPVEYYEKYRRQLLRVKKMVMFADILNKGEFEKKPYAEKVTIVSQIEEGCYMQAYKEAISKFVAVYWDDVEMQDIYHYKCFNVASNLDCAYLRDKLLKGEIQPGALGGLSSLEMNPAIYECIQEQIRKRTNVASTAIRTSSLYRCNKCKKAQCRLDKRQNRSADEGYNLTVTCLYCNNSWGA